MLCFWPQVVALIFFLPGHFCLGNLLKYQPVLSTINKGLHHVVRISFGTPIGGLKEYSIWDPDGGGMEKSFDVPSGVFIFRWNPLHFFADTLPSRVLLSAIHCIIKTNRQCTWNGTVPYIVCYGISHWVRIFPHQHIIRSIPFQIYLSLVSVDSNPQVRKYPFFAGTTANLAAADGGGHQPMS